MRLLEITKNSQYLNQIKEIYLYSFPESERVDFEKLVNCQFPNSRLLGVFDNETLLGFSFISILGNFAYVVYLAIIEGQRNKGYGTKVLYEIFELYKDKTIVLLVEKPNSQTDIQTRRIGFYKRNGFVLANFEFEDLGQSYYSMYKGKFEKQEFIDFLLICFPGCKDFKEF